MNIIDKDYNWREALKPRTKTDFIVVHHAAAISCTADDIHAWHLTKGWCGIGYHYFISKKGEVFRGRPEATMGAHVLGYNEASVGICFEGDYEQENVPLEQEKAGIELLKLLVKRYPNAKIVRHKDLMSTSCPGKNFTDRILIEGMKIEVEKPTDESHWAYPHWKFLNESGITIHEKRFNDPVTRGELFALLGNMYAHLNK